MRSTIGLPSGITARLDFEKPYPKNKAASHGFLQSSVTGCFLILFQKTAFHFPS